MFISKCNGGYDRYGQQRSGPGDFCIFMQGETTNSLEIKVVVRRVSLKQFGHFMMGTARIGGFKFTMSGAYGADGLTNTVPDQIYNSYGLVLPQELYDQWNNGGGWNSCGSEAQSIRQWCFDNLKELKRNPNYKCEPEGFPNIDGLDIEDLQELHREYWKCRRTKTLQWTGQFDNDYDFSSIISHTLSARRARLEGNIEHALYVEKLADEYYQQIPKEFRW